MPRSLPSPMITAITSNSFSPCFLLDLSLVSGTVHVWSGFGSLSWSGNTYAGIGDLGGIGEIVESSEVKSNSTQVILSMIDSALLSDTLNDIQLAAPATLWLGIFSAGAITAGYPLFSGTVGKPGIDMGIENFTLVLELESKLANLQRASNRRYTAADQRRYYSDDSAFNWVESLNDLALLWG